MTPTPFPASAALGRGRGGGNGGAERRSAAERVRNLPGVFLWSAETIGCLEEVIFVRGGRLWRVVLDMFDRVGP